MNEFSHIFGLLLLMLTVFLYIHFLKVLEVLVTKASKNDASFEIDYIDSINF